MPERNAPRRHSVAALTAALIALSGCERPAPAPAEVAAPTPAPAPAPLPPPTPPPPLGRAELLQAMDAAASAYAAGTALPEDGLAGRPFAIHQAFGCAQPEVGGPAQDGVAGWTWGPQRRSIEIALAPADWMDSPLIAPGEGWEAAEGLWLERPWLRAEGCPAAPAPASATPSPAAPQTRGLAAVFAEGGSRLGRRNGRAYSFTLRPDGDAPLTAPDGLRLVVEGRLGAFADGRAIRCHGDAIDRPPVCVAAVQLDRVAFETVAGGLLREWRPG